MKYPNSQNQHKAGILMWIILGISCINLGFLPGIHKSPETKNVARALYYDLDKHKSLAWKLETTFDPYRGGNSLRTSSKNSVQLQIELNGKFREVRSDKILTGRWKLDVDKESLKLKVERINGRRMGPEEPIRQFSLISYNKEYLVLGKAGRHGQVEMKFKSLYGKPTKRAEVQDLLLF
ncbi:MAG: hypothetical protein R8P61_34450 [Bacteroidia bacterium]|nr:hypothetical protein [Bacteroidia bacterium]